MKINFANETIQLSKVEAKKAGVIGSELYKNLNGVREQYPNYAVVVIERKTSASSVFKGMGCEFMGNYVKTHDEDGKIMAEFEKLRKDATPYGAMRKWFFEKYPQFKNFTTRTEWVLAA
jgi:hypothetical protein